MSPGQAPLLRAVSGCALSRHSFSFGFPPNAHSAEGPPGDALCAEYGLKSQVAASFPCSGGLSGTTRTVRCPLLDQDIYSHQISKRTVFPFVFKSGKTDLIFL